MSASAPGASAPLRPAIPCTFAWFVASTATMRFSLMRPSRTPCVHSTAGRSSSPGAPFGISVKSSRPSSFCSRKLNEQWSEPKMCSSCACRPCHSAGWLAASRSGGERTYFAPSKSGSARCASENTRYCGHVSP
jgi:hypothetical protein